MSTSTPLNKRIRKFLAELNKRQLVPVVVENVDIEIIENLPDHSPTTPILATIPDSNQLTEAKDEDHPDNFFFQSTTIELIF
ncbi:hypothetical protein PSHT_15638, partial [Puccinia striiformis]